MPDSSFANPATLRQPDFGASVDVAAHLRALPPDATTKGMFFSNLFDRGSSVIPKHEIARRAGIPEQRYLPFADYPMADNIRLTVTVAQLLHPRAPLGEGLRALGSTAFDTFLGSHVGRVLLGALDIDAGSMFRLAPKVYGMIFNFGRLEYELLGPSHARFTARDLPVFIETFQVGSLEGLLRHTRCEGTIRVAARSVGEGMIEVEWQRRG